MNKWGAAALAASVIGAGAMAQRTNGLSGPCRREVMTVCADSAGQFRQCVRTRSQQLTSECRTELLTLAGNRASASAKLPDGAVELTYGADERQRIDFYPVAGGAKTAPLMVFIHGGGWMIGDKRLSAPDKAAYYTRRGHAFASINYRLVPQATVEQQAADLAAGLAHLRGEAARLGFDPDRIILMGHSAGAHLAALLGTDTAFLTAAGVPLTAIDGVVLLDGAGYDVPTQINSPKNFVQPMYDAAFGGDPKRQVRLSPTFQAAAPNVGDWLILPVASREDSRQQSDGLAAALRAAGARAMVVPQRGKTHSSLNRELGSDKDPATAEVDRFLAGLK